MTWAVLVVSSRRCLLFFACASWGAWSDAGLSGDEVMHGCAVRTAGARDGEKRFMVSHARPRRITRETRDARRRWEWVGGARGAWGG